MWEWSTGQYFALSRAVATLVERAMKIPLLMVFVALLSACSAPSRKPEGGAVPAKSSPPWDPAPPAAAVQPLEEKRNADAAADKYFKAKILATTAWDQLAATN